MLALRKVAVTGVPSSGKSSVCHFFNTFGAHVENADAIVHEMLTIKHPVGKAVVDLVGPDIVEEGTLNRNKIAKRVFADPNLLKTLESLIHPEVEKEINRRHRQADIQHTFPLFVAEVPLLFEAKMDPVFDKVITVVADLSSCRRRFTLLRGPGSEKTFDQRLARQWSQEKKAEYADYIVTNMGQEEELESTVKALFTELCQNKPST